MEIEGDGSPARRGRLEDVTRNDFASEGLECVPDDIAEDMAPEDVIEMLTDCGVLGLDGQEVDEVGEASAVDEVHGEAASAHVVDDRRVVTGPTDLGYFYLEVGGKTTGSVARITQVFNGSCRLNCYVHKGKCGHIAKEWKLPSREFFLEWARVEKPSIPDDATIVERKQIEETAALQHKQLLKDECEKAVWPGRKREGLIAEEKAAAEAENRAEGGN